MAKPTITSSKSYFSIGTIVALNVATVINIYGFPSEAFYGLTSITFYIISLIIFLVPIALVSAELGSMFPQEGGIYVWVTNAFSHQTGFLATWLQWIQSIFFYPLSLTFAAVTFSYIFPDYISSELASNKVFIILFILIIFFLCTFIATKELKNVGNISKYGVWIGIIFPMILLVVLSFYYIIRGGQIEMNLSLSNLIPRFNTIDQFVMAVSIMLFFSGLEVNGVHVYMMKNPTKDYPKALLWSCRISGLVYVLGTLSIAVVIPSKDLNITQSVITALKEYLTFAGIKLMVPVLSVALVFGVLANTQTWICGPSSAINYIAKHGHLPEIVKRQNKNGAPTTILGAQAVIVTIICLIYVFAPKVQQGYQMLLQITNAIYLTMYLILFTSFLKLRYKQKNISRPFKAGKNMFQAWCIALLGILSVALSFILCFFPPSQLGIAHKRIYIAILVCIYIILVLPPILYRYKKKND